MLRSSAVPHFYIILSEKKSVESVPSPSWKVRWAAGGENWHTAAWIYVYRRRLVSSPIGETLIGLGHGWMTARVHQWAKQLRALSTIRQRRRRSIGRASASLSSHLLPSSSIAILIHGQGSCFCVGEIALNAEWSLLKDDSKDCWHQPRKSQWPQLAIKDTVLQRRPLKLII